MHLFWGIQKELCGRAQQPSLLESTPHHYTSFLLHCPWPFEQNFETFLGNDWPPLHLLMHQISKENSPQKQPLLQSQSECEWSPFRCQRISTYLGILPKASFSLLPPLYQRWGYFFNLLLLQAWPATMQKGGALCAKEKLHIHNQQLDAEFAAGVSNAQ